jgi:hypothetical protein
MQISQFVILNRVKDLFSVLQKQILRSAQDDRMKETDFCKMLRVSGQFLLKVLVNGGFHAYCNAPQCGEGAD